MDLMVHFYSKAFLKRITHILVLILLFACDGQTPEEGRPAEDQKLPDESRRPVAGRRLGKTP